MGSLDVLHHHFLGATFETDALVTCHYVKFCILDQTGSIKSIPQQIQHLLKSHMSDVIMTSYQSFPLVSLRDY